MISEINLNSPCTRSLYSAGWQLLPSLLQLFNHSKPKHLLGSISFRRLYGIHQPNRTPWIIAFQRPEHRHLLQLAFPQHPPSISYCLRLMYRIHRLIQPTWTVTPHRSHHRPPNLRPPFLISPISRPSYRNLLLSTQYLYLPYRW